MVHFQVKLKVGFAWDFHRAKRARLVFLELGLRRSAEFGFQIKELALLAEAITTSSANGKTKL
jgi:hypothetical protein